MKRPHIAHIKCTEPGCDVIQHYSYDTRREMAESSTLKQRNTYKCVRHSMGNQVLTPENPRNVWSSHPSRQESYGMFFGSFGILVGHGYYAEAKDFPIGTRIRITIEAIPPDPTAGKP